MDPLRVALAIAHGPRGASGTGQAGQYPATRAVHRAGRLEGDELDVGDPSGSRGRDLVAAGERLMFFPEGQIRVYLYGAPCDMRRSFDGLQAMVRQELR